MDLPLWEGDLNGHDISIRMNKEYFEEMDPLDGPPYIYDSDEFGIIFVGNNSPNLSHSSSNLQETTYFGHPLGQFYEYGPYDKILRGDIEGPPKTLHQIGSSLVNFGLDDWFDIAWIENNHVWLQFENEVDYCRFCYVDTWDVGDSVIHLSKWIPNSPISHDLPLFNTWVEFPDLPDDWFDEEALLVLASVLGRPLWAVNHVVNLVQPRVFIEINLLATLPRIIRATWQGQTIVAHYQIGELPLFCSACNKLGHTFSRACRTNR